METTKEEFELIHKIVLRAEVMYEKTGVEFNRLTCTMDLDCVHEDVGLRLKDLLEADDSNFAHDIGGIARHLNRQTKKLEDGFSPRYTVREEDCGNCGMYLNNPAHHSGALAEAQDEPTNAR